MEQLKMSERPASEARHAYAVAFAYRCEPVDGSAPQASLDRGRGWVSLLASDEEEAMALVDRFFRSRRAIDSFEPAGRYRMLGHELAEAEEIPASIDHSLRRLYETRPRPRTFHFVKHGRGGQVVRHSESFETLERRERLTAIDSPRS
jgi:hypothetical protein